MRVCSSYPKGDVGSHMSAGCGCSRRRLMGSARADSRTELATPGCDQSLWATASTWADADHGGAVMKPLLWIAVPLLLIAAAMLVAGVGEAGLWIALVAVGVALVAVDVVRS